MEQAKYLEIMYYVMLSIVTIFKISALFRAFKPIRLIISGHTAIPRHALPAPCDSEKQIRSIFSLNLDTL